MKKNAKKILYLIFMTACLHGYLYAQYPAKIAENSEGTIYNYGYGKWVVEDNSTKTRYTIDTYKKVVGSEEMVKFVCGGQESNFVGASEIYVAVNQVIPVSGLANFFGEFAAEQGISSICGE